MGLTNKQEDRVRQMPIIRNTYSKSKDGKFVLHRTTIVDIKPIAYLEKVLAGEQEVQEDELAELEALAA